MPVTAHNQQNGIACAGNWIVDVVHTASHWPNKGDLVRLSGRHIGVGGGAANVLTDLASFDAPFPLAAIGCVGPDANGDIIRAHCEKIGVQTSGLLSVAGTLTAYDEVISVPGDSRTFFYHGGANDIFNVGDVPVEDLAADGYRIFYLGYLMLLGELDRLREDGTTGASLLLQRVRDAGMITCVDLVSDSNPAFRTIVAPSLPHCDYLIVNEIEAGRASGMTVRGPKGELLHDQLVQASEGLIAAGVKQAVVIHAPEGALWAGVHSEALWIPSKPVSPDKIVSPVGAGDAFCAAVVYGIHENWPNRKTLEIAHLAAVACLGGATATDGIPAMNTLLRQIEATCG
ncbi:carbohydrate kinase family protein (plasmid) [Agrobacterium radiobacter]|uniref:carbohydrate kinase family protein n=1 Tax=Agrobacterium tumefaciens complex TaxID=1183400 RepID=UPI0009BA5EA7|nr:carbohydrate kinase family protein [Agrobacterium tumefaciens]MQB27904.1 carbohydrate kinase family protein [Agrobacterium tumefaciens]NTA08321.1 carbohydrate kinase family protein [Agrobacterium tumefaciens]NTB16143.1 carbohydrate kinase family protein [Agrobacterium tumefaciens]